MLLLVFVGIIGVIYAVRNAGKPDVANNSVLILSISGDLPDYVAEEPLTKAFGIKTKQSFTSVLTQLRKAKVDGRISAVLLDIDFPSIGWGKASNALMKAWYHDSQRRSASVISGMSVSFSLKKVLVVLPPAFLIGVRPRFVGLAGFLCPRER